MGNGGVTNPLPSVGSVRGSEALLRLLAEPDVRTVADIGSGAGEHARIMRGHDKDVFTVDLGADADHCGDFMAWTPPYRFDAIWASHVLEHQPNPNAFLVRCRDILRPGGRLFVTVPPMKHEIVGGHLSLWNAGLLLYHLVLAGFDCRDARVGTYASGPGYPPYNISAIVRRPKGGAVLPRLAMDKGDIEALAERFPLPVTHGFDGRLANLNW